jgi:hypothetical protein
MEGGNEVAPSERAAADIVIDDGDVGVETRSGHIEFQRLPSKCQAFARFSRRLLKTYT